ncbi:sialidase [Sporosarcina sp. P37]|uniref:F510_1955 family glycosylhydrolase n=1 Tax=unclassified Sporosarcina TaxID=2647733 RepID=UPI000A17EEC3|nr:MULTISPECIES: sialidase [unclassified Sporosarcina]ARK24124.1 sialidase [Sporosarcina sp. P37]
MKKIAEYIGIAGMITLLSACNATKDDTFAFEELKNSKIDHLHGLGYINGVPEVVISTHEGLYAYGEDGWKEANSEKHDYMGFQAVREGFFSSGHPEPNSKLKNPLGLVKSTDHGASFEKLAFYGEIDFHYMAVGYESNAIYALNEMPTKEMPAGLHYSLDEGESWEEALMNGFDSEFISNLAAHPSREELIAIGSKDGLFLSRDYGESFAPINEWGTVTYVMLTETGGLYASYVNEIVKLNSFDYEGNNEVEIPLPNEITPIVFIAVNPDDQEEIVIATFTNDIYRTIDEGVKWETLAKNGELLN